MSRPVGARIIEACTILEAMGQASTYTQIHARMNGVERTNAGKYCQRAVGLRLMTVNRTVFPAQYSLLPGWRGNLRAKVHKPRVARVARVAAVVRNGGVRLHNAWAAVAA